MYVQNLINISPLKPNEEHKVTPKIKKRYKINTHQLKKNPIKQLDFYTKLTPIHR